MKNIVVLLLCAFTASALSLKNDTIWTKYFRADSAVRFQKLNDYTIPFHRTDAIGLDNSIFKNFSADTSILVHKGDGTTRVFMIDTVNNRVYMAKCSTKVVIADSIYSPTAYFPSLYNNYSYYGPTFFGGPWGTITAQNSRLEINSILELYLYGDSGVYVAGKLRIADSVMSPLFIGDDLSVTGEISASTAVIDSIIDLLECSENPQDPAIDMLRLFTIEDDGYTVLQTIDATGLVFRVNQDCYRIARNTSGSTITKGQLVYYNGSTGNKPNVGLAQADSNTTMPSVGYAVDDVEDNNFGIFLIVGRLVGVNTENFAEGDPLYVSSTEAGSDTNVSPIHPNYSQAVATVEVSHATNGAILVNISPNLKGEESGTRLNNYTIGDQLATDKSLTFDGAADATLTWNGTRITSSDTLEAPVFVGDVNGTADSAAVAGFAHDVDSAKANLKIVKNLFLNRATHADTSGVIYKGNIPFIHTFTYGNNGVTTPVGQNTFLGLGAGNLTTGSTAANNWEASYNSAFGYYALHSVTKGFSNMGIGGRALEDLTEGASNTAVGLSALANVVTGGNNTGIGNGALLYQTTYNATAIGKDAGAKTAAAANVTSATSSIFIGYQAYASADGNTNEIVIGSGAAGHGTNTATWGNTSITNNYFSGTVTSAKDSTAEVKCTGTGTFDSVFSTDGYNTTGNYYKNGVPWVPDSAVVADHVTHGISDGIFPKASGSGTTLAATQFAEPFRNYMVYTSDSGIAVLRLLNNAQDSGSQLIFHESKVQLKSYMARSPIMIGEDFIDCAVNGTVTFLDTTICGTSVATIDSATVGKYDSLICTGTVGAAAITADGQIAGLTGMYGVSNVNEVLLGLNPNTAGHEGIGIWHDGTKGYVACVDEGVVWQDIQFTANSFAFAAGGEGDDFIIASNGDAAFTGNVTADTLQGGHNSADGYHGITNSDTTGCGIIPCTEDVGEKIGVFDTSLRVIYFRDPIANGTVRMQIKNGLITYFESFE
jgi:hypothetical protein